MKEAKVIPFPFRTIMEEEPYSIASVVEFDGSDYLNSFVYAFNEREELHKFAIFKSGKIKRV